MLSRSRRIAVLLGLSVSAVLAGPVHPARAQPNAKLQKAGALVNQAILKGEAGDHQGAIDLFNEAYRLEIGRASCRERV